ncbi:MAG: UDP-N-acetylmuramate dehydrogenase [bacterium]|nr:UDP-N-acetylmuramate dehydrogenase [bacterium]
MTGAVRERLRRLAGAAVRFDEPLEAHTSMRVGGAADAFAEVLDERALSRLLRLCAETGVPLFVLGGGTNVIAPDGGWRGVVVRLAGERFERIAARGERVRAGAAARLPALVDEAVRRSLAGIECLAGIPGTVGGAVRMNAGTAGGCIGDAVESARLMDRAGAVREAERARMGFGYRRSAAAEAAVVLEVTLRLRPREAGAVGEEVRRAIERRAAWLPDAPSAGCVFRNPPGGATAGELIDRIGLRGARSGGAAVHDRHANVIVNTGGARARDVLRLMDLVRDRVRAATGIDLAPEVVVMGEGAGREGTTA